MQIEPSIALGDDIDQRRRFLIGLTTAPLSHYFAGTDYRQDPRPCNLLSLSRVGDVWPSQLERKRNCEAKSEGEH